jgi:hypothetical protein
MKHTKDDGGPIYPRTLRTEDGWEPKGGLSLRDYFAGQALVAIAAKLNGKLYPSGAARIAYDMADAMLKKREINSK